ncbi:MAG TPA: hypothetical protein VE959_35830 [Bryobacteraceae bacterium]|nr:hypothetical protein [Bryobacteraceae bacterium]
MFLRLLLTGLLATTWALAQRGGGGMGSDPGTEGGMGGSGGMGGMGGGMSAPMPRITSRLDTLTESLKLDKDQKKNVKSILDEAQKEATPVHEQLVKSRLAVGEAIQNGKNQDEIKQLLSGQAALESQMASIELNAFAKVYKGLEQEQRSQTRGLFQMMKGMFDGKNWNATQ